MDDRVNIKCAIILLRIMAITFQQVLINGICVVCRVGSYPIEGRERRRDYKVSKQEVVDGKEVGLEGQLS